MIGSCFGSVVPQPETCAGLTREANALIAVLTGRVRAL